MSVVYLHKPGQLVNQIILKKRKEMVKMINEYFKDISLNDALDIGTTNDMEYDHSNYLIKNLENIKIFKSISDQKITSSFFQKSLTKSIIDDFTNEEVDQFQSDLVLSSATIERQIKNINKIFSDFEALIVLIIKYFYLF